MIREAAKEVFFLMSVPLRGEGRVKGLPLRGQTIFSDLLSSRGRGVRASMSRPLKKYLFFAASLSLRIRPYVYKIIDYIKECEIRISAICLTLKMDRIIFKSNPFAKFKSLSKRVSKETSC